MDKLIFKLGSKMLKGVITGFITKSLKKQFGCDINVQINDLDISVEDGKAKLHIDVDGNMNQDELMKLMKNFI